MGLSENGVPLNPLVSHDFPHEIYIKRKHLLGYHGLPYVQSHIFKISTKNLAIPGPFRAPGTWSTWSPRSGNPG